MNALEAQKRLAAAQALLLEKTTTREKVAAVRKLIAGINPALDRALGEVERGIGTVEKLVDGKIITLVAEHLPETTEEEKKRKKTLLLFIRSWEKLGGEIARVKTELGNAQNADTSAKKASHLMKIVKGAAGPFGLITVIAVGAVLLQSTAVALVIENEGCGALHVAGSLPPLPGFALPKEAIESGGSGTATLPPLSLAIDGTTPGTISWKALALTTTFKLPGNIKSVVLDGVSLIGTESTVNLGGDEHRLVVTCN